jgi:hypothetical protein
LLCDDTVVHKALVGLVIPVRGLPVVVVAVVLVVVEGRHRVATVAVGSHGYPGWVI